MGLRLSVFKNTLALSVPNVLNPFISFVLVLVISRYLGVKGLGQYSLVLSYMWIFNTVAALGLGDLVVREVARKPDDAHKFLFNAGIFGSISSLVAMVSMDVLVAVMGYGPEVLHAAFVCSFSIVTSTAMVYMEAIFRSAEKAQYVALTYVMENILRVIVCVWLLLNGYGIVVLFAAILGCRIFGFSVMAYFYVKTFGVPRGKLNLDVWRILTKEAPTFTSIAIFSTIHLSIAQIMLSKIQSVEAVGIFSAADRLLAICKTIPVAFSSALLPFFAKQFASGSEELRKLSTDSLRWLFVGAFPAVVGISILADSIISLIYGHKFSSAGTVLRFHILSLIPFTVDYIQAQILIATDNQKVDLMINIAAAITNTVLSFFLISYFGIMGAVFAPLLTIIIVNNLQNLYIRRNLFRMPFTDIVTKVLIASLVMGLFTYFMRQYNMFLNIALSAVLYGSLVVLFRVISHDEIRFVEKLMIRKLGKVDG
jgi:O-antigen/teichoic acid export membrane protein